MITLKEFDLLDDIGEGTEVWHAIRAALVRLEVLERAQACDDRERLDRFAAAALAGLISIDSGVEADRISAAAFGFAAFMLAEANRREESTDGK